MKAIHKYKEAYLRGNPEAKRRIAQSQGYRFSIHDCDRMLQLLYRAGITVDGIDYGVSDKETIQL
jgi:hypothetical protein